MPAAAWAWRPPARMEARVGQDQVWSHRNVARPTPGPGGWCAAWPGASLLAAQRGFPMPRPACLLAAVVAATSAVKVG